MLSTLDISQSNNLTTAWDTFTQDASGEAFDLNSIENNVDSFINYAFNYLGMYKGEIR